MAVRPHTFPVQGGAQYSNDWGGARSTGATGGTGKHQGTDLFAAEGTPVVAVVDGVISKIGNDGGAGGNRIWLNGKYYYAHLKGFAAGLKVGQRVKAGQVIGYVGTTGDAKGTPPHLHFGYDPAGKHSAGNSWANPYDMLQRWAIGRAAVEPQAAQAAQAPAPDAPAQGVRAAQLEFGAGAPVGPPAPAAPGAPMPGSEVIPFREDGSVSELWRLIAPQSQEGRRFLELSGGTDAG